MNENKPIINTLIADNQFLIVASLAQFLSSEMGFYIVGKADNSFELKTLLSNNPVNLLIIDYALMDFEDSSEFKKIIAQLPHLKILILTNVVNRNEISEFARLGIKNVLLKSAGKEELFDAINASLKGRKYYSDDIMDMLLEFSEKKTNNDEPSQLTQSEIDIVRLIAEGLTTKEIAERKCISFHTVMTHRKNIFRKLSINNASELVMYAMKSGMIDNLEYYI